MNKVSYLIVVIGISLCLATSEIDYQLLKRRIAKHGIITSRQVKKKCIIKTISPCEIILLRLDTLEYPNFIVCEIISNFFKLKIIFYKS